MSNQISKEKEFATGGIIEYKDSSICIDRNPNSSILTEEQMKYFNNIKLRQIPTGGIVDLEGLSVFHGDENILANEQAEKLLKKINTKLKEI